MPDRKPEPWESNAAGPDRTPAEQRELLAATARFVAYWRHEQAYKYAADEAADPYARTRSLRAEAALRTLANFVDAMPDDDKTLMLRTLGTAEESGGKLLLQPERFDLLSRFGMSTSAQTKDGPTQAQCPNVLRRLDGCEGRERAAEKRDTT
jgi:hypothetical protein